MVVLDGTLDQVSRKSREYDLRRAMAFFAMLIPFVVGWLAHKIIIVLWVTVAWLWAAAVVGWHAADSSTDRR